MRIVGVTGGVDTHADTHVAAAVDHNGGLLGIESFPADRAGYEELLGWLVGFGEVEQVEIQDRFSHRGGCTDLGERSHTDPTFLVSEDDDQISLAEDYQVFSSPVFVRFEQVDWVHQLGIRKRRRDCGETSRLPR